MLDLFELFTLQLFADGAGDGGAGDGAPAAETSGEEIPSSIPERAREIYKKSIARRRPENAQSGNTAAETEGKPESEPKQNHIAYKDLIKSDEYKAEHEQYMKDTLNDRLKRYKGIEATNARQNELLTMVAAKYGLDASSEGFLDDLGKSIEADDSYYEKYAMEHDMSPQEARKLVTLERKVAENERQQRLAAQQAEAQRQNQIILANAQKCKQIFPQFDLDTEWQNPQFVQLAKATNWDLTAAYRTVHWGEIVPQAIQYAQTTAQNAAANAVKANKSRPAENGLGSAAPTTPATTDYSRMNLQQIREQAAKWRRESAR